jgi:hypothetical protein
MLMNRPLLMLVAALGAGSSSAFMPSSPASRTTAFVATSSLSMTTEDATDVETARVPKAISAPPKNMPETLPVPVSFDEMVRQASTAMADAYEAGITRQMMRVLLPRDPTAANLGTYFESDADVDTQELILAPPDETWQGGIMQLYRACAPTVLELLRQFSARNNGGNAGVPPRMVEDRSMDESGVDGVGLWMTQATNPKDDVSCFVQPSQETVPAIEGIANQAGERLVALVNPQWRTVDDALDSASREDNAFGMFASFLGGKGNSLKRLDDLGFENVYTLEGYVCKGGNIRLIKRFDSVWGVYAENDSATDFIKVGTSEVRPTYQDCDKMLDDMGISLKYARDIGLAPKL